jgi:hypothetical protein
VSLSTTARRLLRPVKGTQVWDLDALARYYGTDKSSQDHDYARIYERYFRRRRWGMRTVLEIGVGGTSSWDRYETTAGGQSLRMWARYFPRASIIGVDIHEKNVARGRIVFERGDQSDRAFLMRLIERYAPFDLVIDDGSHIGRHIRSSFEVLWDAVKPGGFYVIEDLSAAYHPRWEGGPPGTPNTGVALVKELVDSTLSRLGDKAFTPSLAAMHVYAELAILQRAGSPQRWVAPREWDLQEA